MDMIAIIGRIDSWAAAKKAAGEPVSDRKISIDATGSPDTIRNWRRAIDAGREAGANVDTLRKVAAGMKVPPEWLITGDSGDSEVARSSLDGAIIAHLDLLTEQEKALLLAAAEGFAARRQADDT